VAAKGNGNGTYETTDATPKEGNNYYRLKMYDKDGKFTYSYVLLIKVSKDGKIEFVMYPNPVKNQLVISPANINGKININIYNQQGQKVVSKQITNAATAISVAHLPKGIYMVQMIANGITETQKLIKE
jgi:hypothetical protein